MKRKGARGVLSEIFPIEVIEFRRLAANFSPDLTKQCCDTSTGLLQRVTATAVNDAKKCA